MCTRTVRLTGLLVALVVIKQASCQEIQKLEPDGKTLCAFARSAASQTQIEVEVSARLREAEIFASREFEVPTLIPMENSAAAASLNLNADRKLFESFLISWPFYEDLSAGQRVILRDFLRRCGVAADRLSLVASVFGQFDASQRATFVGVTHALLNTSLTDGETEEPLSDALELVQELVDIQGENNALPSDQQFQLIVRLAPGAREKLEHSSYFLKGENHILHKGFPMSFRQIRRIGQRGQEAGLHFCLTRDGSLAQVHIDYRFGLLHLWPANSDVRADGNHQRHADRWPKFTLAVRPAQTRRVLL